VIMDNIIVSVASLDLGSVTMVLLRKPNKNANCANFGRLLGLY
jgi:hypothetical protein